MSKMSKMAMPMMMFLSLTICGCAATASRVAVVKPTDSKNTEWAISAKANNGAFSDQIFIYINDEKVAEGNVSVVTPRCNLTGTYNGKKIDAECMTSSDGGIMTGHKCTIYISGNKATELSF